MTRPRTILISVLAIALIGGSAMALLADTVVLQQGATGYAGATAATLWAPGVERPEGTGETLSLRGAKNRVLLRFELPAGLRGKELARARLEVFAPEAKDLRMICEIMAREVLEPWNATATWEQRMAVPFGGEEVKWEAPGGALDETSDYQRGRPAGVVDSHSLWEYDGEYFPHRYRRLGLPAGGKWLDFDITPLARKWLADPSTNLGVALAPVDLPDTRFPNTAAIDLLGPASSIAAKRPRLVLEFAPLPQPYLVGVTHTLERISDLDTRYRYTGPFEDSYRMAMARNEVEGFQVVLYAMLGDLEGVTFTWSDLVDPRSGARITKSDLSYFRQHVFPQLHENGKTKDWYFHGRNFAVPDALLPAAPARAPEHLSTPFWFNIRTRPDTQPGEYQGAITVKPTNAPPRQIQLAVRVWDYALPEQWNFQAMGQMVWDYVGRYYGEITPRLKRRYIDFLMDHRFNPTEQYVDKLSPDPEDLKYVVGRGGNTIYLSGNFHTGSDIEKLKASYEVVRKLGLIDLAHVYIGDETSDWTEMRARSDRLHKACPEAMIMIGGSYPRPELQGIIDIYDPQIDVGGNDVYSLSGEQMKPLIAQAQARGEKFVWYVAAGPMLPCPNVQMEEPLIASRALFWLTWKFGVTGFEYYCYNIWEHNLPKEGEGRPEAPLSPQGWGETNGDGMLFYPGPEGPLSSVRFENIRDGVEDWESHYVLRDYAEALRAKSKGSVTIGRKAAPLLEKADRLLAVPEEVVKDFTTWTWEPSVLLAARQELGETINAIAEFVTEEEALEVRKARKKVELKRQRDMLDDRARAAR